MAFSVSKLIDQLTEYVEVKTEQFKLNMIGRISRLLSSVLSLALISILGLFFTLFLSLSIGAAINEALYSEYLGYLIVTGFYFLLILVLLLLVKTKKIQRWFERLILNIAEQDDEQND